jgi:hypothetical protein
LGDFLDDFAVAVRRGNGALNIGGVERAFVFQLVQRLLAGLAVHLLDGFAFLEKHAVHADLRLDGEGIAGTLLRCGLAVALP